MKVTYIERSPGTWRLRIEAGRDAKGARQFSYETLHGTEDDAARRRFEILTDHEAGTWAKPDKILFGAYLDRWLAQRLALGLISRTTKDQREAELAWWVKPTLGGLRLQAVAGTDIQNLYTKLLSEPGKRREHLSAATVRNVHATLTRAFKDARKAKLLKVNPMEEVEAPVVGRRKRKPKALDEAGVQTLLAKMAGKWFEPITLVGLGAGLRRGEVCGLRWRDVDMEGRKLHVRGQLVQHKDNSVEWVQTKTEAGERVVSLPAELADMLRALRRAAAEARLKAGLGGKMEDAYVFPRWGLDLPTKPNAVTQAFGNFCDDHGLPDFTFHGTRHTHATALLKRVGKEGAKAVSQRLGHADIRVTLEVYQSVFESDDRELGDMASGIFGSANAKGTPVR